MAPPPVRILEGLFGMLDHRVLVAHRHRTGAQEEDGEEQHEVRPTSQAAQDQ